MLGFAVATLLGHLGHPSVKDAVNVVVSPLEHLQPSCLSIFIFLQAILDQLGRVK